MSQPYTVLMLYPDYATDNFGQDTYTTFVDAEHVGEAIEKAQQDALEAYQEGDLEIYGEADDFHVLAVYDGHLENYAP